MKPPEDPRPRVTRSGRFGDDLTLKSAGLYVALLTGYHGRRAGELILDAGSLSANVDPRGNRPFRRMVTLRQTRREKPTSSFRHHTPTQINRT
jgi:hypothetical protein